MVVRISTMAAAAALLLAPLATPVAAQMPANSEFRGGGHISNFVNCPDWGTNVAVTSRVRLFEDGQSITIFAPSVAYGWSDFGEPDDDGWERVRQTGLSGNAFTNEAEIRLLNITPPDTDMDTESFNVRFWVRGFPSSNPNCRAEVRLNLRQNH